MTGLEKNNDDEDFPYFLQQMTLSIITESHI